MSAAESPPLNQVYLGLGSNIQPEVNLPSSIALLSKHVMIFAISRVWETLPTGNLGPNYLNAVARLATSLSQIELKIQVLRPIEAQLGRVRTADRNIPRTIDLDILLFNENLIDNTVWKYAHICVPMAELLPDYIHPFTGETIQQATERLKIVTPIKLSNLELKY